MKVLEKKEWIDGSFVQKKFLRMLIYFKIELALNRFIRFVSLDVIDRLKE